MKVVGWRRKLFTSTRSPAIFSKRHQRGSPRLETQSLPCLRWNVHGDDVQIGFCDLKGNLVVSSSHFRSSGRATSCRGAQGVAYFLVRDVIWILYSLLTPSPQAIASYTTSHIPTANAFFYRSLPFSPLATVSERSIRNSGLPVVPVVWPLLTGGEAASTGDVGLFTLIWSMGSMCGPAILANRSCREWWFRRRQKLLWLSLCVDSLCFNDGWNVGCWWGAVLDQCTVWWSDGQTARWKPSPLFFPRLTQPHLAGCFFFFYCFTTLH